MNSQSQFKLLAICIIAFLSGAASLIYQINWQRELTLIFGVSHYATTTVIFAFFLGFALGSHLIRKYADTTRHLFLLIALLELTVATFAWFSPHLFELIKEAAAILSPHAESAGWSTVLSRAFLSTITLAIPTICMGATVPVFIRAGIINTSGRGKIIGLISGINTLGAVGGSAITAFVWMGSLATGTQVLVASGLNVMAAAIGVALQWMRVPIDAGVEEEVSDAPTNPSHRILVAYALSGAAGLGLEVVWNRLALLCLDHTIYTFALTLTIFLACYFAGSLFSSVWMRRHAPSRQFVALLQILSALFCVVGLFFYRQGIHASTFSKSLGYFPAASLVLMSFLALPTFFLGMAAPQFIALIANHGRTIGNDTGFAQAINNLGSLLSIFIVGFVLIPFLPLKTVALICIALLVVGSVLCLEEYQFAKLRLYAPAFALTVAGLVIYPWKFHLGHLRNFYSHPKVLKEDESGLWGIDRTAKEMLELRLNGYYENHLPIPPSGVIQGDFLIPAMIMPEIKSAFMVGLGFGVGAYELLKLDEVDKFHVAELSSAALKLAKGAWKEYGPSFFDSPKFAAIHEDGRIYLEHTPTRYDLVISGTNRSFYAGSTHLYSQEYWKLLKSRLSDRGMLLQWLPIYSDESAAILLKTFVSVFPDALIMDYTNYAYMIGFATGIPSRFSEQVKASYQKRQALLKQTAIPTADSFLRRLQVANHFLLMEGLPLNRDDFPIVEYSFRGFEEKANGDWAALKHAYLQPYFSDTPKPKKLARSQKAGSSARNSE